ncbi:MAG: hypothetical protein ABJC09_11950 [Terriglobia bacterium]
MKKVNRMILIAAGALTLGSAVYGQTAMTADIPFAFRASGATMPAGRYEVIQRTSAGVVMVHMRNRDGNRNVLAVGWGVDSHHEGNAQITFLCRPDSCTLREIRTLTGTVSYGARSHAKADGQVASAISVPLNGAHGE